MQIESLQSNHPARAAVNAKSSGPPSLVPCTTVAVFRCVAVLSLSVMRGRRDVVTLRYLLSRSGWLPGPGDG